MKALFSKFMALPVPGKAMLGMAVSGGVFGILWLMGPPFKGIAPYVGVAMVVLTVVLSGFALLMEGRSKKKAAAVEEGLAENASASPAGVSKVEDRAALDRMRGQFEKGITTFKDYGKDLYSMPWYVVVGEPGSGKTEAIRHSGIGFPPGLQDQLQGTGGTVNMNWWFTDKAVLLDTAGRLMFEDVAPGENNEWREFLRLLRASRPNCPINGMLLVIPADTLITDTTDELQQKAGKIAQQFDQIQRTLGVRFPVFVLITKSDLINGFREFFDDITDPVLSAQMLGWSNPDGLDEPFAPDRVEEHLETIRVRLLERRFALLQDPVHSTDAKGRRIDQVDALYKFPEALTEIGPRLRRYLEMIFVSGEWSQKPLFLRGIYLTSSMREGEALDAALAETLGVSVESLPSSGVMKIERSYFLRDVFLDKVFKESRLVTRAANAGQVKRKRSMVMIGAGVAAALVIGVATYMSWSQTQKQIGEPHELWTNVWQWTRAKAFHKDDWVDVSSDEYRPDQDKISKSQAVLRLTDRDVSYDGDLVPELEYNDDGSMTNSKLTVGGNELTSVTVFTTARRYYERSTGSGGMYALLSAFTEGGVFERQLETQALMFERLAFAPAAEGARRWLDGRDAGFEDELAWDAEESPSRAALAAMLSMELDHAVGRSQRSQAFDGEGFRSLIELAVGKGVRGGGEADEPLTYLPELTDYFGWLYSEENLGKGVAWPPAGGMVPAGTDESLAAVTRGVDRFIAAVSDPSAEGTLYGKLNSYQTAAADFEKKENALRLVSLTLGNAETVEAYDEAKAGWEAGYRALQESASVLNTAYDGVKGEFGSEGLNSSVLQRAKDSVIGTATSRYDELLAVFEEGDALGSLGEEEKADTVLKEAYSRLDAGKRDVSEAYGELVADLVDSIDKGFARIAAGGINGGTPAYQNRLRVYAIADEELQGDKAEVIGGNIADRLAAIRRALDGEGAAAGARGRIMDVVPASERAMLDPENPGVILPSANAAAAVLDAVGRFKAHGVIEGEIERLGEFGSRLDGADLEAFDAVPFSTLDELNGDSDYKRFAVSANQALIADFEAINRRLEPGDGAAGVLDRGGLARQLEGARGRFDEHIGEFAGFWSETFFEHLIPALAQPGLDWGDFQSGFPHPEREIEDAAERLREALALLEGYTASDETASRRIERALEIKKLADEEYADLQAGDGVSEDIEAVFRAWKRGLVDDAQEARDTLIGAIETEMFFETYMPLDPPTDEIDLGPIAEYYSWVTLLGLDKLVEASGDSAQRQITRATQMSQRFPVTLDAAGASLTLDELKELGRLLGSLPLDSAQADGGDAGRVQRSRHPLIDRRLMALTGDNQLGRNGGQLRQRLKASEEVVDALVEAEEFGVTVAFFGVRDSVNAAADPEIQLRQARVTADGVVLEDENTSPLGFRKCEAAEVVGGFRFDCPLSGGLKFEFIESDNDRDRPWVATIDGYGPLRSLANDDVNLGESDVWPLAITVERGGGQRKTPRVGFVFREGDIVGLRGDWPRLRDWR